jgi:enterochelin esterase-like enzyme
VLLCFSNPCKAVIWEYKKGNLLLRWDLEKDHLQLVHGPSGAVSWQGSLLPGFWLRDATGKNSFVKAKVLSGGAVMEPERLTLALEIGKYGKGSLQLEKAPWGLRVKTFQVEWNKTVPAIIEMYLGASLPSTKSTTAQPGWDRPFFPDWQTMGYCVPGAKAGTVQSYFRKWDMGNAAIALGNFGPSMGTPYGAGFPRPVLFAGMGNDGAWLTIGAGSVPDGALSLKLQSTRSCLQYLYREDLWGPVPGKTRVWEDPWRITIDSTAYAAFSAYYASFPPAGKATALHGASAWNTWGMWRNKQYAIPPIADLAQQAGNETLVLDDPWESSQGSGKPNTVLFPRFYEDLAYIRSKGMQVGLWETVGWVKDPTALGLDTSDLVLDKARQPCKTSWSFDPEEAVNYCLDISSARARRFLEQRTAWIMRNIKPHLLKLDFGYGLPNPDMGVPRDPRYRGERYCFELIRIIASAAKRIDPKVIILYYGISPLWAPVTDMVSLDDQGDLWYNIHQGHQEWSIWASLLSQQGVALSGSSGYDWEQDGTVLRNTLVLGVPGAVLPVVTPKNTRIPIGYLNRRLALNKWYRRTLFWEPWWGNSITGNMQQAPQLRCWGRMEQSMLTALVLDEQAADTLQLPTGEVLHWSGSWGLIAQDTQSVSTSGKLAVIPFREGRLALPCPAKPDSVTLHNVNGQHVYDGWKWVNNQVVLSVSKAQLDTVAGFVVHRAMPYQDLQHHSKVFGREKPYRLYLPKDYHTSAERYPVIYFFHGWGGRHYRDDNAKLAYEKLGALVDKYKVILVMCDGNIDEKEPRPYNVGNHEDVKFSIQMKDYFPEMVSYIDSAYRTLPDRGHRGIIGFSMGGFMSLFLAGKYPDQVSAAVSLAGSPEFFVGYPDVHTLYPLRYTFQNLRDVKTRIHNGNSDILYYLNREVHAGAVWEGDIPLDYREFQGGHEIDKPGETRVFETAMQFVTNTFQAPLPKPKRWSHYDLYPDFSVWGYHVHSNQQQAGFLHIRNADRQGFGVYAPQWLPDGPPGNTGPVQVTTDAIYSPNKSYRITEYASSRGQLTVKEQQADAAGRLTFNLDQAGSEISIATKKDTPNFIFLDHAVATQSRFLRNGANQLRLRLFNRGGEKGLPAEISLSLHTADTGILIRDPLVHVKFVAGEHVLSVPPITVYCSKQAPPHAEPAGVKFRIRVNAGATVSEDECTVPVLYDAPAFSNIRIDDGKGNRNGLAEAGEKLLLYEGDHRLRLYTDDPWIDFKQEQLLDEMIPARWPDGFTLSSLIQVAPGCPDGHQVECLASYETKTFNPIERKVSWGKVTFTVHHAK